MHVTRMEHDLVSRTVCSQGLYNKFNASGQVRTMDILEIFEQLKCSGLDTTSIELLKHAYESQQAAIERLQGNSKALQESNDLLKSIVHAIQSENRQLREAIETLKAEVSETTFAAKDHYEPSPAAESVLKAFFSHDRMKLYYSELVQILPEYGVEVEKALDELQQRKLLRLGWIGDSGSGYSLTSSGKEFITSRYRNRRKKGRAKK